MSRARVVRRCCNLSPQKIVEEIFADLDRFNTERFDDQTLIVMRVIPKQEGTAVNLGLSNA